MSKKHIQVAGNPKFSKPTRPNDLYPHPDTGNTVLCQFPGFQTRDCIFQPGPIQLRRGQHTGPNSGFGVEHIRIEHYLNITDTEAARVAVVRYVVTILQPGAMIYYEGGATSKDRAIVCRRPNGLAVIEARKGGMNGIVYSVVTAYPDMNPRGYLVGSLP